MHCTKFAAGVSVVGLIMVLAIVPIGCKDEQRCYDSRMTNDEPPEVLAYRQRVQNAVLTGEEEASDVQYSIVKDLAKSKNFIRSKQGANFILLADIVSQNGKMTKNQYNKMYLNMGNM